MGALLLLSLLGIGLTAAVAVPLFEDDDDDTPRAPQTPGGDDMDGDDSGGFTGDDDGEETTSSNAGNDLLRVSDGETVSGGEGNDTIASLGVISDGAQVFGGPGNDALEVVGNNLLLVGGGGDDEISLETDDAVTNSTVQGGSGDDSIFLTEATATRVFGGIGDDNITAVSSPPGAVPNLFSGGDGDDTLSVGVFTPDDAAEGEDAELPTRLQGGEGNDLFQVGSYSEFSALPPADVFDIPASANIDDFEPGSDLLLVQPGDEIGGQFRLVDHWITEGEDVESTRITVQWERIDNSEGGYQTTAVTLSNVAPSEIALLDENAGLFGAVSQTPLPEGAIAVLDGENEFGTPEDDFIVTPLPLDTATTIWGNAGNDTLDVAGAEMNVHAGAGDDTVLLEEFTYASTIEGGRGADTITADAPERLRISGGLGDDELNLNLSGTTLEPTEATGGDGNDRLNVSIAASEEEGAGVNQISGGAGEDTFDLTSLQAFVDPNLDTTPLDDKAAITITDYNPAEDVLILRPDPSASAPFTLTGAATEETEDGDTILSISIENSAGLEQTTVINLLNVTGFDITSVEDIVLLS